MIIGQFERTKSLIKIVPTKKQFLTVAIMTARIIVFINNGNILVYHYLTWVDVDKSATCNPPLYLPVYLLLIAGTCRDA